MDLVGQNDLARVCVEVAIAERLFVPLLVLEYLREVRHPPNFTLDSEKCLRQRADAYVFRVLYPHLIKVLRGEVANSVLLSRIIDADLFSELVVKVTLDPIVSTEIP